MDLTNSKRLLFTASYVRTELTDVDRRHLSQQPQGALTKINAVQALALSPEDVGGLAQAVDRAPAEQRDDLARVLVVARHLVGGGPVPADATERLALVPDEAVLRFAELTRQVRDTPSRAVLVQSFQQSMKIAPIGRIHLERIEMFPVGVEKGELVFTTPMAPGETVTVSHKEWATSASEYEQIVQDSFESYSERGVVEKTDASMSTENEAKHANTMNFGATLSGGYGPVTLTTTLGLGATSEERESVRSSSQRNREVTEKASSRARQEHKVSVKLEAKKGVEDSSFRTVSNPSADAVRVDYYKMMRRWRTDLYRYGLRMTYDLTVPTPGVRLWARWRRLAELDAELAEPFVFTTAPSSVDADWQTLADTYGVSVAGPPKATVTVSLTKNFPASTDVDAGFEFTAPPGYRMGGKAEGMFTYWGPTGTPELTFGSDKSTWTFVPQSGGAGTGKVVAYGVSGGDKLSIPFQRAGGYSVQVALVAVANLDSAVLDDWRTRTWQALRTAAQSAYAEHQAQLQGERDHLYRLLAGKDTLTLRRLEREELVRLIMTWLLGPLGSYADAPAAVSATLDLILSNELRHATIDPTFHPAGSVTFDGVSTTAWAGAVAFGELVSFVHQAVEWENLLYFLYPYFWGSEVQARDKLLFEHLDPEHERFLRAGYARVVLTIRPGFEADFTRLVETGSLAGTHTSPYLPIAQQIAAFARTNYAGIPPANPEHHARPLLYPQQRRTWDAMSGVIEEIEQFRVVNGSYPASLTELPGPVPDDAWGNALVYAMPGSGNDYDLVSYGADGTPGGTDLDADISSACGASLVATWFDYTPTSGLDIVVNTLPADLA